MPFNFKERYRALQRGDPHPPLDFPSEKDLPYKLSDSAKDLIKKMLTVDPRQRICMEDVPYHKWMMKKSSNLLSMLGLKHGHGDHHKVRDQHDKPPTGDLQPAHTDGDEKPKHQAVQGPTSPKADHPADIHQDQGRTPQTQV
jgi:serine/threonine protein kinase